MLGAPLTGGNTAYAVFTPAAAVRNMRSVSQAGFAHLERSTARRALPPNRHARESKSPIPLLP